MKSWGLVLAFLTVTLWAVAQTGGSSSGAGGRTAGGSATAGMQAQPGTTPATAPGGTTGFGGGASVLNTGTGTAFINAPPSQPALVAPVAHLGTAAPVVGATNATPGNIAGAVNSTMSAIPGLAPLPIVGEIANPVPVVIMGQQGGGASPTLQSTGGLTISGTINPGVPFNTGVGGFSGGYAVGTLAENQASMGDIARQFRARRATEQTKMFTNEDVQRMNQATGVGVSGGTSGAVTTSAPGSLTQPTGNAPAVAQPGTMNPPASPGVATPVPPQPPPMSQMQSGATNPTEMAQATPPSSPEATPATSVGTQRPQRQQLPRAASVLPLMALVGFLAAAAGLLAR